MEPNPVFMMQGGLDLVTPRIAVPHGRLIAAVNFEPAERGYRRTGGYERFDGRSKPSAATYFFAPFDQGVAAITTGQTVTGQTSGATAIALATSIVTSGSYGGSNAVGYLPLVAITGTFQANENLQVSAVTKCRLTAALIEHGAPTDVLHNTWIQAEMERRRALIQKPTGSGTIIGVWTYNGSVYAFRNNAGGTAADMWVATASGWSQVTLHEKVFFNNGTAAFLEDETLTRLGVTSTIRRIVLQSGTWAGGNAAGYLVISGRAGGNYAAGVATSTSGSASLTGVQTAITLPPNGRYEFINHRFEGTAERMHGVNGEGPAFEFDGTYLVPIHVPGLSASVDKPLHIKQLSNHLFLTYRGGSVMHSNIGNAREFSATSDAGEHNLGSTVTNMIQNASTSLVFICRQSVSYLIGSDNDTFELRTINSDAGGFAASAVMLSQPIYIDDRGVRSLSQTMAFGDWSMGSLSELVAPFFDVKHKAGRRPTAAIPVKGKSQYRVFYSDGSGMVGYFGRKSPEFIPFELPIVAKVAISGEDAASAEILFVGATDGHVYQMDIGPSFDGAAVFAWQRMHFVSPNPSYDHKWDFVEFEMDGSSETNIAVSAEYDYGGPEASPGPEELFTINGGGAFWDAGGLWDTALLWDGSIQGFARADLDGYGYNCSPAIISEEIYDEPYTLSSARFFTSRRRLRR